MMDEDEFQAHVDDVLKALGKFDDKTREEVEKLLRKYIFRLFMAVKDAKKRVVEQFGGDTSKLSATIQKKIAELRPGQNSITVVGRILSINEKEVEREDRVGKRYYGVMGDDTGVIFFNAWYLPEKIKRGDVIRVDRAYVKEFAGRTQLYIGNNSIVTKLPADAIPFVRTESKYHRIIDLKPGMRNVEIVAKILDRERRTYTVSGEEKTAYSGVMVDESGKIQYTSWGVEPPVGKVVRIKGAYVNSFRRLPQIVFDDRCKIEVLEGEDVTPKEGVVEIYSLINRGGIDVVVEGVIVDVREGSGLVGRCPVCGERVEGNYCSQHGFVEVQYELRVKCVVDDGSGAVFVIFNNEQSEKLLNMRLEECIKIAKESMSVGVIEKIATDRLFGMPVVLRGNVLSSDKYGLLMLPKDVKIIEENEVKERIKELYKEVVE